MSYRVRIACSTLGSLRFDRLARSSWASSRGGLRSGGRAAADEEEEEMEREAAPVEEEGKEEVGTVKVCSW